MRNYELTYLISPELSDEEINSLQERIKTLIQNEGGIFSDINPLIKKGALIYLVSLNFQLSPEKLEAVGKQLKQESKVLRYLILVKHHTRDIPVRARRLPRKTEAPSKKTSQPKVELKEIEKKLDEILGE